MIDPSEHNGRQEAMEHLLSAEFREELKHAEVILRLDEKTGNVFMSLC
jgi:hypothetical protein